MLTLFTCVSQPTTTSLFLSASKFHQGLLKRVNPTVMKKKLRCSLTASAQLFLIDLWQRILRKCARLHGTGGSCPQTMICGSPFVSPVVRGPPFVVKPHHYQCPHTTHAHHRLSTCHLPLGMLFLSVAELEPARDPLSFTHHRGFP